VPTGPLTLAARGGDLVPGPFRDDLPLELGAGQPGTSVPGFGNSTSRPIEVAVLNCCVTETNDTLYLSNVCIILAKSSSDRLKRSTL
jgi:hypothetical protein